MAETTGHEPLLDGRRLAGMEKLFGGIVGSALRMDTVGVSLLRPFLRTVTPFSLRSNWFAGIVRPYAMLDVLDLGLARMLEDLEDEYSGAVRHVRSVGTGGLVWCKHCGQWWDDEAEIKPEDLDDLPIGQYWEHVASYHDLMYLTENCKMCL